MARSARPSTLQPLAAPRSGGLAVVNRVMAFLGAVTVAACSASSREASTSSTSTSAITGTSEPQPALNASDLLLEGDEIAELLGLTDAPGVVIDQQSTMRTWCSTIETPVISGASSPSLGVVGQSAYVFKTAQAATEVMGRAAATPAPCDWDLGPFVISIEAPPVEASGIGDRALLIDLGGSVHQLELMAQVDNVVYQVVVSAAMLDEPASGPDAAQKLSERAILNIEALLN